ncbi:MAG TPA: hypothetical protein VMT70_24305, partial [Vicinamibacteria bacterium]|nr:hypothetical protein [Vicinamibacteria bacterium]
MAVDVEGDDPAADRAHGPDDGRRLVDGVRDHEAATPEPAADQPVALAEQPVGLAHGAWRADEQVFHDQVEPSPFGLQVLQRVGRDQLETEVVEAEVLPRDA